MQENHVQNLRNELNILSKNTDFDCFKEKLENWRKEHQQEEGLLSDVDGYETTLFHIVCRFNDNPDIIQYLIQDGFDSNKKNKRGATPGHLACGTNGNIEIIKYLFDNKICDINQKDIGGYTAIHYAWGYNTNVEVIKYLFEKFNSHVNEKNINGDTPFHAAYKYNMNFDVIKYLIEKSVNFNEKNIHHNTPLHLALLNKNVAITKLELLFNAKQDYSLINNKDGNTQLHLLLDPAYNGQNFIEFIVLFITHYAQRNNIMLQNNKGDTPLHLALRGQFDSKIIQCLIKHIKANDLITENKNKESTLGLLLSYKNFDLIKFLIEEQPVILGMVTHDNNNLLHLAVLYKCDISSMEYLIEKGINIDEKNIDRNTPLHLALLNKNIAIKTLELLINSQQNYFLINNKDGNNQLHLLLDAHGKNKDFIEFIVLFITHYAQRNNIMLQNNKGDTPLHLALRGQFDSKIIQCLIKHIKANDLITENKNKESTLGLLFSYKNFDFIKFLIEEQPVILGMVTHDNNNLLHLAVLYKCDISSMKYLIEKGVNINKENDKGNTPLHLALRDQFDSEIIQYLFTHIDSNILATNNKNQHDLMHGMSLSRDLNLFRFLIEKQPALLKMIDRKGNNLIHLAFEYECSSSIVEYLIEKGVDINKKNNDNRTPLFTFFETTPFSTINYNLLLAGIEKGINAIDFQITVEGKYMSKTVQLNLLDLVLRLKSSIVDFPNRLKIIAILRLQNLKPSNPSETPNSNSKYSVQEQITRCLNEKRSTLFKKLDHKFFPEQERKITKTILLCLKHRLHPEKKQITKQVFFYHILPHMLDKDEVPSRPHEAINTFNSNNK